MLAAAFASVLLLCGCADSSGAPSSVRHALPDSLEQEALSAAALYGDLLDPDGRGDIEAILSRLSERGYSAVDFGGALDFANADRILDFCAARSAGESDPVSFLRVCDDGGLIDTCFYLDAGQWRCRSVRVSAGSRAKIGYTTDYPLTMLKLTDKSYLIYTCEIPDNTAASKHDGYIEPTTMLRLAPHDAECDRYTRLYITPVGYNFNNLFTCTWSADDPSELHINDLYLTLYAAGHGSYISYFNNPYPQSGEEGTSLVPAKEFEDAVMKYTALDRDTVRALSHYDAAADAYPVTIEGPHDGLSRIPVPEVVAYRINADGSITLTVDALFVEYATDRAVTHVVTVMPAPDGSFKYLSNELLVTAADVLPDYVSRIAN